MSNIQKAIFAEGCFWGVEDEFRNVPGVVDVTVGYTGGHTEHPTYEQVSSHTTGHAEAVEIAFDADQISYEKLLEHFFELHDPTQLNRQGPDIGDQYRSAIFYLTDEQRTAAEFAKQAAQQNYEAPVVTQIEPAGTFWPAEEYHQQYLEKARRARS